ncbi:MAG: amino acid adenylation domain-containing protein, partial [bacterium]|nr:amino acid adenylation domain-containing protein [bacterium]
GLSQSPLLRVALEEIESAERLAPPIDLHHIITHCTSEEMLGKEFHALYAGEPLPPGKLQYKDFSEWQNRKEHQEILEQQERYWINLFSGEIPVLNLPIDYPRPVIRSFDGAVAHFVFSETETHILKQVAREADGTIYMVILALYTILLAKLGGQEDILVGTPIAARRHADLQNIIGMFINTLVMRNYPAGSKTFKEFLNQLKERVLNAFENQEYQFEELVEHLALPRDTGRNPIFDVMFNLLNQTNRTVDVSENPGQDQQHSTQHKKASARFDLNLTAVEMDTRILFSIGYCTKLFKASTIERIGRYLKKSLSRITENKNIKIANLEIISEEEKKNLLYDFNDTASDYPAEKTIHELFVEQAAKTPDRVAITGSCPLGENKDGGRWVPVPQSLTYSQLNRKADHLAGILQKIGLETDTIVAIMEDRTVELIAALLAILKTGGAYLPIDPTYPVERIDFMLKDSNTPILITTHSLAEKITFEKELIYLDEKDDLRGSENPPPLSCSSEKKTDRAVEPASPLAYVIYTSGSTGKPKGVAITHRAFVNFRKGMTEVLEFSRNDTILSLTTICFDIFGLEVHLPLTVGAKVVLGSARQQSDPIAAGLIMEKESITIFQATPSRLQLLFADETASGSLKALKYLLIGGEALSERLLLEARELTRGKIYNLYGPTETTIWSSVKEVTSEKALNIGKPIANTQIYIMDKWGAIQPKGVVGELCIGGDGLARGYLNRPALTCEKFIKNPYFSMTATSRPGPVASYLYRTGDLARWLPDGNIECLGRIDFQVKIRGFRIEMGEIESQLLKLEEIKENIVLVKTDHQGEKYLCAYIVPHQTGCFEHIETMGTLVEELRKKSSRTLPGYMIPALFLPIEKLPLTPNGKVDRKALPEPEFSEAAKRETYIAPADEIEESVAEIWAAILGIKKTVISIDANFFQLGGHSLKATIMVSKIHKEFNTRVPLAEIFKTSTIRGIARYIKKAGKAVKDENLVLLKKQDGKAGHLFFVHDGTGEIEGYVEFCDLVTAKFNQWGLRTEKGKNIAPQNRTVEELAGEYIKKIKKIQFRGPYNIVGWSLGGTIAFEITRQLEEQNEDVGFLALIDSPPPCEDIWKTAGTFNLQSELDFIKGFSIYKEIEEKLRKKSDLRRFWRSVVNFLEASDYDAQIINQVISDLGMLPFPKHFRLNIQETIRYLNMGRTLGNARAAYTPAGKIHTTIHYFAASQTETIVKEHWNAFCHKAMTSYEISGDHYSIFKKPGVVEFAGLFSGIINT